MWPVDIIGLQVAFTECEDMFLGQENFKVAVLGANTDCLSNVTGHIASAVPTQCLRQLPAGECANNILDPCVWCDCLIS